MAAAAAGATSHLGAGGGAASPLDAASGTEARDLAPRPMLQRRRLRSSYALRNSTATPGAPCFCERSAPPVSFLPIFLRPLPLLASSSSRVPLCSSPSATLVFFLWRILGILLLCWIGEQFENQLQKLTGRRTHDFSTGNHRQFFLLATFRRYLFHLNEENVALVLESCLGGVAANFRVAFQSHNHFRFSVSCKAIGFEIFKLRRIVAQSFDVYFHLWSNGAPHWEREKRIWEQEEARKRTLVLSKGRGRRPKGFDHN